MTIIVITYNDKGFPHMEDLRKSNPDATIHKWVDNRLGSNKKKWRTCDEAVRLALKALPLDDEIWILEFDVLVRQSLPRIPKDTMIVNEVREWGKDKWMFWKYRQILGKYKSSAIGGVPLAVLGLHRNIVNNIIHKSYDLFFMKTIHSELRLPTLVNHLGYNIQAMNHSNIKFTSVVVKEKGIFHPVKKAL